MGEWEKTGCILCAQNCGLEALIEDGRMLKVRPDKENPRRVSFVKIVNGVIYTVNETRDCQLAFINEALGNRAALLVACGLRNILFCSIIDRPAAVCCVGLPDINHKHFYQIPVILVELFQSANLALEGRSGITPKNQEYRLLADLLV